jgi:hypothetical protein
MKLPIAGLVLLAMPLAAFADTIPAIEPVYGVTTSKAGVTVRLASNGCTKKGDLTVAVANRPPRPLILVTRKRPDTCQSFAAGHADIAWTWAEVQLQPGQPFSLGNPLTADPSPGADGFAASGAAPATSCRKLEVVAVVPNGQGPIRLLGPQGPIDIEAQPLVAPAEVTGAEAGVDGGENVVRLNFAPQAAARLQAWTAAHVGGRVAILLDGRVIRLADVGGPLGSHGLQIGGSDRQNSVSMAAGIAACAT